MAIRAVNARGVVRASNVGDARLLAGARADGTSITRGDYLSTIIRYLT